MGGLQLDDRLLKEGIKSHKERVEEFNKYLANMSEHHDMYVLLSLSIMPSPPPSSSLATIAFSTSMGMGCADEEYHRPRIGPG